VVICDSCGEQSETDDIMKSCGNCFGCVGCEIYICPHCESQIVVQPLNTQKR
jgi:hypothetical protein